MPRKAAPKPDDPKQSKRFIQTTQEIGVDTRPSALERAFASIELSVPGSVNKILAPKKPKTKAAPKRAP